MLIDLDYLDHDKLTELYDRAVLLVRRLKTPSPALLSGVLGTSIRASHDLLALMESDGIIRKTWVLVEEPQPPINVQMPRFLGGFNRPVGIAVSIGAGNRGKRFHPQFPPRNQQNFAHP